MKSTALLKWEAIIGNEKEFFVRPRVHLLHGHLMTVLDANIESEGAIFCRVTIRSGEKGYIDDAILSLTSVFNAALHWDDI